MDYIKELRLFLDILVNMHIYLAFNSQEDVEIIKSLKFYFEVSIN